MSLLRAFVLDDEQLAVRKLVRMLQETGRVEVVGSNTDSVAALDELVTLEPDVLFLDIEMPGLTGFEFLSKLSKPPLVVFTTAYSQYALQAFEVNSIDYLLKPIEDDKLARALSKLERMNGGAEPRPQLEQLMAQLANTLKPAASAYPEKLPSRTGEKIEFVEMAQVTHFYAQDKLTFAATASKSHPVDFSISELEQKLDPKRFIRIHRSTLLNIDYVQELHGWFGGKLMVRLKDPKRTELAVARERVASLKERLGL